MITPLLLARLQFAWTLGFTQDEEDTGEDAAVAASILVNELLQMKLRRLACEGDLFFPRSGSQISSTGGVQVVAQAQSCGGTDYYNAAVGQCVTRYSGGQNGH